MAPAWLAVALAALAVGAPQAQAQNATAVCRDGYELCGSVCFWPEYASCDGGGACVQRNDTDAASLLESGLIEASAFCEAPVNACGDAGALCDSATQTCAGGECRASGDVFRCGEVGPSTYCEKDELCTETRDASSSGAANGTCTPLDGFCVALAAGEVRPEPCAVQTDLQGTTTTTVLKGPHQPADGNLFQADGVQVGQFSDTYICGIDCSQDQNKPDGGVPPPPSDDSAAGLGISQLGAAALGAVLLLAALA